MTVFAIIYAAMIVASTAVLQSAIHTGAAMLIAAMAAATAAIIAEIGVLAAVLGIYTVILFFIFAAIATMQSGAWSAIKKWWAGSELKIKLDGWVKMNTPNWFQKFWNRVDADGGFINWFEKIAGINDDSNGAGGGGKQNAEKAAEQVKAGPKQYF